jgi:hypothetical protein
VSGVLFLRRVKKDNANKRSGKPLEATGWKKCSRCTR